MYLYRIQNLTPKLRKTIFLDLSISMESPPFVALPLTFLCHMSAILRTSKTFSLLLFLTFFYTVYRSRHMACSSASLPVDRAAGGAAQGEGGHRVGGWMRPTRFGCR